jgi:hypothetical protein
MTANAVVAGTFADLRTVKSRSVVQMVIEIPIERGASVVEIFGFPQPGAEIAVAVARLVAEPVAPTAETTSVVDRSSPPPAPARERTPWDAMKLSQQAAILCGDIGFQRWIKVEDKEAAAEFVRQHCGVPSRKDLDEHDEAASRWNRLAGMFRDFQRYGDMR